MSLVSPAEVRQLVTTDLDDAALQAIIDRVEAEVTARYGPPQDDAGTVEVTRTLWPMGDVVFLPVEPAAIVAVVEDGVTLGADEYSLYPAGVLQREPPNTPWIGPVTVTYRPVDDRPLRKQVIIDLVRLVLERTAMAEERIGDYGYKAVDFERERRRLLRRLGLRTVG